MTKLAWVAGKNLGKQRRQLAARATKHALEEAEEASRWNRPDKSDWDHEDTSSEQLSSASRIVTFLAYIEWQIVHYSIKHEVKRPSGWVEVYRSDSSHDEVHRHDKLPDSNDYKVIRQLDSLEDLDAAYAEEHSFVSDTCTEREERWVF